MRSEAKLKRKLGSSFAQPPGIGFMISVIKWFNAFLTLAFAHFRWICHFEEPWCQFHEPFWINNCDLPHVLFCSHYQLMVDDPVWLSLKKSAARVDINWLVFNQGSVTFLWILSCCMKKESRSNRLPYLCEILPSTHNVQLIPALQHQFVT